MDTLGKIEQSVDKDLLYEAVYLLQDKKVRLVNGNLRQGKKIAEVYDGQTYYVGLSQYPSYYGATYFCSCNYSIACKHITTTRLAVLAQMTPDIVTSKLFQDALAVRNLSKDLLGWINRTKHRATERDIADHKQKNRNKLLYVLRQKNNRSDILESLLVVHATLRMKGDGFNKSIRPFYQWDHYLHSIEDFAESYPFVLDEDFRILNGLRLMEMRMSTDGYRLNDLDFGSILPILINTGRCYVNTIESMPLTLGPPREGRLGWKTLTNGSQRLELDCGAPNVQVIPTNPSWYVDNDNHTCGPIMTDVDRQTLGIALDAPDIRPQEIKNFSMLMPTLKIMQKLPQPAELQIRTRNDIVPKPTLRVVSVENEFYEPEAKERFMAKISFQYENYGSATGFEPRKIRVLENNEIVDIERNHKVEAERFNELGKCCITCPSDAEQYSVMTETDKPGLFWLNFQQHDMAALRESGWTVIFDEGFTYNLKKLEEWKCSINDVGQGWFDVGLGILVDNKNIDLVPILQKLLNNEKFRNEPNDTESDWFIPLDGNNWISIPAQRAHQLLQAFADIEQLRQGEKLRISKYDLGAIAGLDKDADFNFDGGENLRALARTMALPETSHFEVPKQLKNILRPYQVTGYDWLQLHAKHALGGVLADDMGLGKTIQLQTHLLAEKLSGNAKNPSLAIVPRNVLYKWKKEYEKFPMDMKVLVYHGDGRETHHGNFGGHDLVITTYAMLNRDLAHLQNQEWHCVVLDEAHTIRNARTKIAAAACSLKSHHRFCATWTPYQNNLSDLWSIMNFVAPGLLRGEKWFRQNFITPIEKNGDQKRAALLTRMLKPFLLRRTKQDVKAELPPLTETVNSITLEGKQRDLYEIVRASMETKVRNEIATKGFNRSRIVVLQALLQLRQVCCDPRLLKIKSAKQCESAKLRDCMQMVEEIVSEKRKVLLFSNFTSMLDLIKPELKKRKIKWGEITGATKDREKPQEALRNGDINVLLVSMKAGGEGADLQMADTVILYEPWWNPFAEQQAVGRAHRDGQVKEVLLIRMLVQGSIEERMMNLQNKKMTVADAVLSGSPTKIESLTMEDVNMLLAPLDSIEENGDE